MKPLKLSKFRAIKLEKLCKEFFPNYKAININYSESNPSPKVSFVSHKEQYGYKAQTLIHWYQLCLTDLPYRIWNSLTIKGKNIYFVFYRDFLGEIAQTTHPVDYLYNFVNSCKKQNYFKP